MSPKPASAVASTGIQSFPVRFRYRKQLRRGTPPMKSAAPQSAEYHKKHQVRRRPRIVYVFTPVEMPPSILFAEPWHKRCQQGERCKHHQEKDETGAAFVPAFPGVHGSSLRTKCRNSSRKPSGEISNIVAPWLRNSAANRSASRDIRKW